MASWGSIISLKRQPRPAAISLAGLATSFAACRPTEGGTLDDPPTDTETGL
jgi:hypothetical protein